MNKKKLFLPIILIFISLLIFIVILSNRSVPELIQTTPSPNEEEITGVSEGQTTKEEIVMLGNFEVSWSDPTEEGIWIYFDNDKGVRAAVIPVDNFGKLNEPQSYTYSLEEDYTVFVLLNHTSILKYGDKYMGIIPLDIIGEARDAQLRYYYEEL